MNPNVIANHAKAKAMIEYFMGIDCGGFDKNTYSICVMKRTDGNEIIVEYLDTKRDKKWFDEEVQRLAEYYHIPKSNIREETD